MIGVLVSNDHVLDPLGPNADFIQTGKESGRLPVTGDVKRRVLPSLTYDIFRIIYYNVPAQKRQIVPEVYFKDDTQTESFRLSLCGPF